MELRLHLAPSYRLENGALQPINKEQNGGTALSFDRRKTVGDLRLAIYQVSLKKEKIVNNCCVFKTMKGISCFVFLHLFT